MSCFHGSNVEDLEKFAILLANLLDGYIENDGGTDTNDFFREHKDLFTCHHEFVQHVYAVATKIFLESNCFEGKLGW